MRALPVWNDAVSHFVGNAGKFITIGKLHFLVREVQFQFEQRGEMQKFVVQSGQFSAELSTHLAHGHLMGCLVGRGYQVGHSFRLREVHLSVEESPLGKLAWQSLSGSVLNEQFQYALHDIWTSMTTDFGAVLTCIAMWCAEYRHQHIIHSLAYASIMKRMRRLVVQGTAED